MTTSGGLTAAFEDSRIDVRSTDGTTLAVWIQCQGPPLVLVHGSLRDLGIFTPPIQEVRPRLTIYAMDRRGFGSSGDIRSGPHPIGSVRSRHVPE
jgi:pimeloyl-ACP methyl ester carboxylesterase